MAYLTATDATKMTTDALYSYLDLVERDSVEDVIVRAELRRRTVAVPVIPALPNPLPLNAAELTTLYKKYDALEKQFNTLALSSPTYITQREDCKAAKAKISAQIGRLWSGVSSGVVKTASAAAQTAIEAALRDPATATKIGLNVPTAAIEGYLGTLAQRGEISGAVLQQYTSQVQMGRTPSLDEVREALLKAGLIRLTPDEDTKPGMSWQKIVLIGAGVLAVGITLWLVLRKKKA